MITIIDKQWYDKDNGYRRKEVYIFNVLIYTYTFNSPISIQKNTKKSATKVKGFNDENKSKRNNKRE